MKIDVDGNPRCDACGHAHGPLFVCESYSAERKAELRAKAEQLRASFSDPAWLEEHKARGVPDEVLAVMRAFLGDT
jgi:hypothetical protein